MDLWTLSRHKPVEASTTLANFALDNLTRRLLHHLLITLIPKLVSDNLSHPDLPLVEIQLTFLSHQN